MEPNEGLEGGGGVSEKQLALWRTLVRVILF